MVASARGRLWAVSGGDRLVAVRHTGKSSAIQNKDKCAWKVRIPGNAYRPKTLHALALLDCWRQASSICRMRRPTTHRNLVGQAQNRL